MAIAFTVPGEPVPQGSKRVYRGHVVEDNPKTRPWRAKVRAHALAAKPLGWSARGPMEVGLVFWHARPKGHLAKDGWLRARYVDVHAKPTRPDLDKLVRAVLDACTDAGLWRDDSQVVTLAARKAWVEPFGAGPRAEVIVRAVV